MVLLVVVPAQPAAAHALLIRSEPVSGATLAVPPRIAQLWFSEDISQQLSSARLVDGNGATVAGSRLVPAPGDPRLLEIELPDVPAGTYGLVWQVLAADDGHTTSGAVVFNVGSQSRNSTITASRVNGAKPLDVARRWLNVACLVGLVGGLAVTGFVMLGALVDHVAPELLLMLGVARRRILTFAACCAAFGALVGILDVLVQIHRLGSSSAAGTMTFTELVTGTRWGHLWFAHEAALLALLPLVLALRAARTRSSPNRRLLTVASTTLALTLIWIEALGSHAGAVDTARGSAVVADAVHVLAACLWLGGLAGLVLMLWPYRGLAVRSSALARLCRRRFTGLATANVGALLVTGLYGAGRQIESVQELVVTSYGRTLLIKTALLMVMGALGLINSTRLHTQKAGASRSLTRRLVSIEMGVGAVLLVAASVLAETAPSRSQALTVGPSLEQRHSGVVADLVVTISATPNRPGINWFTVLAVSSRRPAPAPVDKVELEMNEGGGQNSLTLRPIARESYFGIGRLDGSGSLQVRAVIHRAGRPFIVQMPWQIEPVDDYTRSTIAPNHRLAPYANTLALSLVTSATLVGICWLAIHLVLHRRRRPAPTGQPENRILARRR